jgi:hypothetical protein
MKFGGGRFNLYFSALLAVLLAACETTGSKDGKAKASELSTLRVHLESHPDPIAGTSTAIKYGIDQPQTIYVTGAVVSEMNLIEAEVWDGNDGQFAIRLQFDREGARSLEMLSMSYRGKRLVIQSQFPSPRWIGTVRMERRIADGALLFRPEATRDEAARIVSGLNKAMAKMKKLKE